MLRRPRPARRYPSAVAAVLAIGALVATALPVTAAPAPSASAAGPGAGYANPVTENYSVDFPDPAVIKGKDGYWYAFATGGPYDDHGQDGDRYKIARSSDLTTWERVGTVFDASNWPSWADPGTGFWAPDVRYVDGQYVLYYSVHNTNETPGNWDYAIGVATAPTPAGPWTDTGEPIIAPRPNPDGGFYWTIDPAMFTDTDGQRYLYWGSYSGGLLAVSLTDDGLRAEGEPTQVANERFEAPYVVRHGDHYYLFASSSNCCAGPTTGYAMFVGRADDPLGPFVDREGSSLLESRTGGTPVLAANGNRWVGTGHASIVTDVAGQDWFAYHAVDRTDPYVENSNNWLVRPMLLDRLDWVDGWPTVNAGAGATQRAATGPDVDGTARDAFEAPDHTTKTLRTVTGELTVQPDDARSDAGGFARLEGAPTLAATRTALPPDQRVEADVRNLDGTGSVGVAARFRSQAAHARAVVDTDADGASMLKVEAVHAQQARELAATELPSTFDPEIWSVLAVQVRGDTLTAEIGDARLGEPYATVTTELPRALRGGGAGALIGTGTVDADNFSAAKLHEPVTELAPTPSIGAVDPAHSDDFTDGLGDGWTWRNENPDAEIVDGRLTWPTEARDLTNDSASEAGLLLRDQPAGEYVVETKLDFDIGTDTVRNFQQAGLLVYVDDENWLRLNHVASGERRVVEFAKRMRFEDITSTGNPVTFGGAMIGPPAETTWLRLAHDLVPETGEHRYRAASSTDGETWVWGAAWTLPADSKPRIGLVSQGSSAQTEAEHGKALAEFDYFHVRR